MRVVSLHRYPVKSCRGIDERSLVVEQRGFPVDRRFMVVDEHGGFRSQRGDPLLATVAVRMVDSTLHLECDGAHVALSLARAADGPRIEVAMRSFSCVAHDQGDEAAAFLTDALGSPSRLVWMPDDVRREARTPAGDTSEAVVGFADAAPYLVTSVASLDSLQQAMDERVPMDRFRANIVIEGGAPWAEDSWSMLTIGDTEFDCVAACTRCAVTTTDQRTGERFSEPLRALGRLRRTPEGVAFGVYVVPRSTGGVLCVGDPVAAG